MNKLLIERAFFSLLVMRKTLFSLLNNLKDIIYGHVRKFGQINIFIRLGSKLYRQILGIPMDTYCPPLVADIILFCYERRETSCCHFLTIIKLIL